MLMNLAFADRLEQAAANLTSLSHDELSKMLVSAAAIIRQETTPPPERVPYQAIVDAYHSHLPSLPKVKALTEARKRAIRSRWNQFEYRQKIEHWQECFRRASRARWLMGENNRGWVANFDFFLQDSSLLKLEEGYYDPRDAASTPDAAASRRDTMLESIVAEHNRRQVAP